jgi:hypothetical protein
LYYCSVFIRYLFAMEIIVGDKFIVFES